MRTLPVPQLGDDRILRVISGLRPCRRSGLRIESESIRHDGKVRNVVHNYGQGGCGLTIGFGCAEGAADLVQHAIGKRKRQAPSLAGAQPYTNAGSHSIAVLGAGVIGLTTARELTKRGFRVCIYAETSDVETTSGIAGGLWLPTGIEFGTSQQQRARFVDILHRSQRELQKIDRNRYRVEHLPVFEPEGSPYEAHFFDNGTVAPPKPIDHLPFPGPERAGRVFFTDFIHTHGFLRALREDVRSGGVDMIQARFESLDDVFAIDADVTVNCLGLGARTVFGDTAVYPARGVLVLMEPEPLGYIVHDGYKYLFPREDALILGGCFQPDTAEQTPDQTIANEILTHHRKFFGE